MEKERKRRSPVNYELIKEKSLKLPLEERVRLVNELKEVNDQEVKLIVEKAEEAKKLLQ